MQIGKRVKTFGFGFRVVLLHVLGLECGAIFLNQTYINLILTKGAMSRYLLLFISVSFFSSS